jgi:hypothetical protein
MVSKHTVQKYNPTVHEYNPTVQKYNPTVQIYNPIVQEHNQAKCCKCDKVFAYPSKLARHTPVCKGNADPKACDYCNKTFKHTVSKYRHHKICKVRITNESTPPTTEPAVINNNVNFIETQNNNTYNLVIYNPDPRESMHFNHDHIDPKKLKKILISGDKVDTFRLRDIVREYTHQLLAHESNKCVKKTNIRSSHSKVHVGNNNWESRLDKEVYPHLMNNIANDFSDFFNENYRRDVYKALDAFIDYMASDGYCSSDSDKRIENCYKTLVKELKLRTFDDTKRR